MVGNLYKGNDKWNEPRHEKPTKWLCAQRRLRSAWTSAQSSLIRVFPVCMKKAGVLNYPFSAQQTRWSDWADAQADLAGRTVISLVLSCRGSNALCPDFRQLSTAFESPHDKTNKMTVHSAKTQISLGIRPVWSESSLCPGWYESSLGAHAILLVLSWGV